VNPLRADLARRLDPTQIAKAIGLDPLDDYQRQVIMSTSRRIAICAGRQCGKSTACSILAVWELLQPGATVLLLAPNLRIAQELHLKCLTLYRAMGRPIPANAESSLSLSLANGSRLICVPGCNADGIRGYACSAIFVDEAARVSEEAFAAARAMISVTKGRIVLLSSPAAKTGFFWDAWSNPGWEKYAVRSDECPRISAAWLAEERRSLPGVIYESEHENVFWPQDAQSLFSDRDLAGVKDPRILPLGGDWN
jgi:Terminase large subunit, T4likevirus-type, N-terminal